MKSPRILMVINKPEREVPVFNLIKGHIQELNPKAVVELLEYHDPEYRRKFAQFEATTVVIYPFTARGLADRVYAYKHFQNFRVVSYRTEGQISYSDKNYSDWMVGFDEYDTDLVDWELFWGRKTADVVGQKLLDRGKLESKDRIRVAGYPRYEVYFGGQSADADTENDALFRERAANYPREKVLFFITGFCIADYSLEDLIRGGDVFSSEDGDPEQEEAMAREAIKKTGEFRRRWIEIILKIARKHPDVLIAVKSHPVENIIHAREGKSPYQELMDEPNIMYFNSPINISTAMSRSGLFFHYGSTVGAESYIAGTPSIFTTDFDLYPEDNIPDNPCFYFHDLGWPATRKTDISDVPKLVDEHLESPIPFIRTEEMSSILDEVFDIKPEHLNGSIPYESSRDIARFLLDIEETEPLPVKEDSPHLDAALRSYLPTITEWVFGKAVTQINEGKPAEALKLLDKLYLSSRRLGLDIPDLQVLRASCLAVMEEFKQACKVLEGELSANPQNQKAKHLLGQISGHCR